jgi:hypothetical protein
MHSMVCSLDCARIFLEVYLYSLLVNSLFLFLLSLHISSLCVVLNCVCCLFCLFFPSFCCLFGDFSGLLRFDRAIFVN